LGIKIILKDRNNLHFISIWNKEAIFY